MGSLYRSRSGRSTDATTYRGLRRPPARCKSLRREASASQTACETDWKQCSADQTTAVAPSDASRGDDTARGPRPQHGGLDARADVRRLACVSRTPLSDAARVKRCRARKRPLQPPAHVYGTCCAPPTQMACATLTARKRRKEGI